MSRAGAAAPARPIAPTRRGTRPSTRAAILLFVVFVIAMFAIAPVRAWLDERGRLRELERRAARLEAENAELEARVDDLRDPRTLERLARACLGMVAPGEVAIVPVPPDGASRPPAC
ncbi:MAG: hypothetical protein KatS3mg013_1821 [Actinomycetota bacterium]|jgi:cell division protein FtsB|nr:MAG: hypothetical protein KatS3mg013_1821 [Actinomycetota bacterium]